DKKIQTNPAGLLYLCDRPTLYHLRICSVLIGYGGGREVIWAGFENLPENVPERCLLGEL
ncbi:hypothetical protein, partial [Bacteroides heparinolyticus]